MSIVCLDIWLTGQHINSRTAKTHELVLNRTWSGIVYLNDIGSLVELMVKTIII